MNHNLKLALAFAVVYVVWGSTYLAIRIAVHDLPPALMAGVRFLLAGLIMLALARYQKAPWPTSRHDWTTCLLLAVLMVFLGNGLVTWGEQWVESNQAALLISTGAIWTTFFGTFGARAVAVSTREKAGIAVGLTGAVLMLWPEEGLRTDYLLAQGAILAAPVCWSIGTIYARTYPVSLKPIMFAAVQMLLGSLILLTYAVAAG
ncbi:MAG: EamA family transporter, partial [Pseudomonadota bacterium]